MAPVFTTRPNRVATSRLGDEGCIVPGDDLPVAVLVLLPDQGLLARRCPIQSCAMSRSAKAGWSIPSI
jgi:hypothetical protein